MAITLSAIYRYPVKGLAGERLQRSPLHPGEAIAHDRRFAIAHGSTRFESGRPTWLPKTNFLMLMRDEKLAQLSVGFTPEDGTLALSRKGKQLVRANVTEPLGRTLVSQFFSHFMAEAARGSPNLVEAPGECFSDTSQRLISVLNLSSVRDLERVTRAEIEPARFRSNLLIEGLPAWQEFTWIGKRITIGTARLKVLEPIERCAATNVNPTTAERDLNLPLHLQRGFGHVNMGVYARVEDGGEIESGDTVAVSG